ncbi:glycoside hydrolase family 5 protein [Subtercola sp. RTI3]|uniref:glycoside hydrolase family 5 protein n=1 Tax=Subtercola sp. RTI3 TaxID=3048639 RepID=UPI002B22CEB3|nr:cellulase family glycosylhydrolase [Subtercola sp. RTI3]MEA9987120.1 cellulase family glycosylhydrolase [Subtercola sp. RTI3]
MMTNYTRFSGFVHARHAQIVDGTGAPLLLRGMGLGNWLLAEGYMWKFGDEMSSPRQIEARIVETVGAERADEFWTRYRDTFITEADIQQIAEHGFDHVRLPFNSRGLMDDNGDWIESGFTLIDRAIEWCERHNLWILLDLHGAPGGQTGTNIDDSPRLKPELFMNDRYRKQTVKLWQELARRYRDRTHVLGYDLLNEPLPNEWQHIYADELVDLYRELTTAIREIDPDHLIVYEGSHWATNWSIFTDVIDPNSALQFHRYWCPPERSSIAEYLEARDRLGLPIYMGEGGENTPEWIYAATRLYEQHNIGWNFWPWKKLDTRTSPISVRPPADWNLIIDQDANLEPDTAQRILNEFLDNIALVNCSARPDVINALFGRHPLRIPAWGYIEADATAPTRFSPTAETDGLWHHTAGEPYRDSEVPHIQIDPGAVIRFPLETRPSAWTINADDPASFAVTWEEDHLAVRALTTARLLSLDLRAEQETL